jgi:hypothetical protein
LNYCRSEARRGRFSRTHPEACTGTSVVPKILHLAESDGLYGAEQVILALSREMMAGGQISPVIGVLVKRSGDSKELFARAAQLRVPILPLVCRKLLFPFDLVAASFRIRRAGIDLVHSHNYKPSLIALLTRQLLGIPALVTCHLIFRDRTVPLIQRMLIGLEHLLLGSSHPSSVFRQPSGISSSARASPRIGLR